MSSPESRPYATPAAFRRALVDRLKAVAAPNGPWPLADLHRQFAYDRLLHRLYLRDGGWIIKGATAMLAREIAVRHTVDIDIYRATSLEQAERDLRDAAALDAGDWFEFEIGPGAVVTQGATGTRFPVIARVGPTEWARFHVDLVGEAIQMTGAPDDVPPLTPVLVPGLERPGYRAYPIVDHIADKICAILDRYGTDRYPSTRFKDLIDLVRLISIASVTAQEQLRALTSEAGRRSITLPNRFVVPDRDLWGSGYAAEAHRAIGLTAQSLDEALKLVSPYIDPLLENKATGSWNPEERAWR